MFLTSKSHSFYLDRDLDECLLGTFGEDLVANESFESSSPKFTTSSLSLFDGSPFEPKE